MEEKDSYSPIEIAQMIESYHRIPRGGPRFDERIKKYEQLVPKNVRGAIKRLIELEEGNYTAEKIETNKSFKDFKEFFDVWY